MKRSVVFASVFVAGAAFGVIMAGLRPAVMPGVVEIIVTATPVPDAMEQSNALPAPPDSEPAAAPTPNGLTRCHGFVWGLPVRESDYRVTATFGVKAAGSAYYNAMNEVGALRAGATAVMHEGVDFGLRPNSPIFAVTAGEVVTVTYSDKYGKYLVTRYSAREVLYGHLNDIFVEPGQFVACGQVIGISGATGRAVNGAHLHLEAREGGAPFDPMPLLEIARAARPATMAFADSSDSSAGVP